MAQQPNRGGIQRPPQPNSTPELQPQTPLQPALSTQPTVAAPVQVPGAGEVTGVTISKQPRPLNGQELAAIVVYKIAELLARDFANNGRMSEISAFGKHKVRFQIWAEIIDPSDANDRIVMQAAKELQLDLSIANVDYLRAESGIGLWHEGRAVSSGSVVEFRQQPTKQVLEHLRQIGPELVKDTQAALGGLDLRISGLGG